MDRAKGIVYLVGAGPGDPRLITVRGRECLERADVVVYDRLSSPRLLQYAKEGAERVYVGKLPDRHTLPQDEINQLLADYAKEGKTVVRLKGGDPAVFGRVAEEAQLLAEQGVDYEIIPGITSAIAVPLYAGIPVTHRELTPAFHVVSGHLDPMDEGAGLDWQHLAKTTGTLIILMGAKRLEQITNRLITYGRDRETPVAVIHAGTTVEQKTVTGTLHTITDLVREAGITNPAIIVVGEVVALRETLAWLEKKPLFGKRIVVTRARSQASVLSELIEELGGEAYEFPVIRTAPPDDWSPLDQALERLEQFDWLIFTSVNGVEMFFDRLKQKKIDIRRLATAKIAAVGTKTAGKIEEYGLLVDVIADEFKAEGLVESLSDQVTAGDQVLFPRSNIARKTITNSLREKGVRITEVDAYQTQAVTEGVDELRELLRDGAIHAITFTSASTVKNFLKAFQGEEIPLLLDGVTLAAIGPITADAAIERGLHVDVTAKTYTIPGLIDALIEHIKEDNSDASI